MNVLFTTAEIATKRGRRCVVKMMEENWDGEWEKKKKEERAERRKWGTESEE